MEFKSSRIAWLLLVTLALLNEQVSARRRGGGSNHGRQGLPIRSDLEQHATRHEERRRKASGTLTKLFLFYTGNVNSLVIFLIC